MVFAMVVLGAAGARAADAQAPAGLTLLALPNGHRILCRVPDGNATGAAAAQPVVQREFLFDPPDPGTMPRGFPLLAPRSVVAMFDSTGRPLLIADEVSRPLGGKEHVVAIFPADGPVQGRHIRIAVDSTAMAAARAAGDLAQAQAAIQPPVSRELTADEGERARALGNWLWVRRCAGA